MRVSWVSLLVFTACSGDGSPVEELEIAGSYTDAFGSVHTIDEEEWLQQYPGYAVLTFTILSYDNGERMLVAHNGPENAFNPDRFSRFDWLDGEDGHLYYCQTAFDAATEDVAFSTPRANPDLATGCGGFEWTDLTP